MLVCICLLSAFEALPAVTGFGFPPDEAELVPRNAWLLMPFDAGRAHAMGPAPPKPPPTETIAIIVQYALYANVSAQVTQYRQDLNDSGYNTILYTSPIDTPKQLKGNLTQWYTSDHIVGAVLIGRLPYAQYFHDDSPPFVDETFICDLYLMDLDGNWWDINPPDGIYDVHNATAPADIYPEILIGRIDPECLTWGGTVASNINTYLARLHSYRTGGVQRQRRALVYVDDDWAPDSSAAWAGDVSLAYPTVTLVDVPKTWTNASDWLNRLAQDYQWTHLAVHSNSFGHAFGSGGRGGEGSVTSDQIRAVPPAFSFYNLFACSAARWTSVDSLAVTYVWSSTYGLAAVGSAKTGGMLDCQYFYNSLSLNATIGESLAYWFSVALTSLSCVYPQVVEWYYGMNIVGDPFLTIYYDCTALPPVISSSTHPSSSSWYADTLPQFNWTVPRDVNGIVGYYYIIDQNPSSTPSTSWGTYTSTNGTRVVSPPTDGTWYLHVVSKDGVGNVGKTAAHYRINVDTTSPVGSILSPLNGSTTLPSFQLQWSAVDAGSGYHHAQVRIDGTLTTSIFAPNTAATVTALSVGPHTLNVTLFDTLGFFTSSQVSINVSLATTTTTTTSPPIPGFPWEGLAMGLLAAIIATLFMRRRRR